MFHCVFIYYELFIIMNFASTIDFCLINSGPHRFVIEIDFRTVALTHYRNKTIINKGLFISLSYANTQ